MKDERFDREYHWTRRFVIAGLVFVGLGCGLLGWVASAEADPFTPELEADWAYAEQWWGQPLERCSSVTKEVAVELSAPTSGGEVAQIPPPPPITPIACIVRIRESVAAGEPCERLETVVHEYGHLLGLQHSANPADVMYSNWSGIFCQAEIEAKTIEANDAWRFQVIGEFQTQLTKQVARCRQKTRPASRRWCRFQVRQLRAGIRQIRATLGT